MALHAPLEYQILRDFISVNPETGRKRKISYKDLELLISHNENPLFSTEKFRLALIDFRTKGYNIEKEVEWTRDDVIKYSENKFHFGLI